MYLDTISQWDNVGPELLDTNQNMKKNIKGKGDEELHQVKWADMNSKERFNALLRRWLSSRTQQMRRKGNGLAGTKRKRKKTPEETENVKKSSSSQQAPLLYILEQVPPSTSLTDNTSITQFLLNNGDTELSAAIETFERIENV